MEPNTNQVRKSAAFRDRDFVVTFEGWAAVRVETVSPVTGDLRTIWTPGRPVGSLTKAAISNARMRVG